MSSVIIPCRVGLIARVISVRRNKNTDDIFASSIYDNICEEDTESIYLLLGEIFDKSILSDKTTLFEFHQSTKFTYPFSVTVSNNCKNIELFNLADICIYQQKYKLTKSIRFNKRLSDGKYRLDHPMVYDISCYKPLFNHAIERPLYNFSYKNSVEKYIFIILPCNDPMIRGEIINNCIEATRATDYRGPVFPIFYLLGGIKSPNTKSLCSITRKYLISIGIEVEYIYTDKNDIFPLCINNAISNISELFKYETYKIFICLSNKIIQKSLVHIRKKYRNSIHNIRFICN